MKQGYKIKYVCMDWNFGWGNGYVGIPKTNPLFGREYDDCPVEVHGGLTYSDNYRPGSGISGDFVYDFDTWWLGFDTAHLGDTPLSCPADYVMSETLLLYYQLIKLELDYDEQSTIH